MTKANSVVTSIQLSSETRAELSLVKARVGAEIGVPVFYDDILRALIAHWRIAPPADVKGMLAVELEAHDE